MIFSSVMMLIGVVSFSFANGALASIITSKDNSNGQYQERVEILEKAKKEYEIPESLYRKMKKSINYSLTNDTLELNQFVKELPNHLQNQMSLIIFNTKYMKLQYFHNRS